MHNDTWWRGSKRARKYKLGDMDNGKYSSRKKSKLEDRPYFKKIHDHEWSRGNLREQGEKHQHDVKVTAGLKWKHRRKEPPRELYDLFQVARTAV